jgi:hypothetical protein
MHKQRPARKNIAASKKCCFFVNKKVANDRVSGIIATNLGKTATRTKVTGRKNTDTSLQNMPSSLIGGGHFF